MKLPAEIAPESITAIIDTREQLELDLAPLRVERAGLATGDYSVKGLEDFISLERKSLPDLLGCMTTGRERFERELQRMLAYPCRGVIVEASWADLLAGEWRSQVSVSSAIGSVLGWMALGIPFLFVGSHQEAGKVVGRILYIVARRRWREARQLAVNLQIAETKQ